MNQFNRSLTSILIAISVCLPHSVFANQKSAQIPTDARSQLDLQKNITSNSETHSSDVKLYELRLNDKFCHDRSQSTFKKTVCTDLETTPKNERVIFVPKFEARDSGEYIAEYPINLSPEQHELLGKSGHTFLLGLVAMGIMLQLPEGVTKWNDNIYNGKTKIQVWNENVRHRPVIDKDSHIINYVGHPISGAAYYTMARETGLSATEAFIYTTLMSTFFWEYGIEASAEIPSIQDLVITPILGALAGEVAYRAIQRINKGGGKVLGSRILGTTVKALLDPLGTLVAGSQYLLNPIMGDISYTTSVRHSYSPNNGSQIVFSINFPLIDFKFVKNTDSPESKTCNLINLNFNENRTDDEILTEATRAFAAGHYCDAAKRYSELDLYYPQAFLAKKGIKNYFEALQRGHFFKEFLLGLESYKVSQKTSPDMEYILYLQLKNYSDQISNQTQCLKKMGQYLFPEGITLPLEVEGRFLVNQFHKKFPKSNFKEQVRQIDFELIKYQDKQASCF